MAAERTPTGCSRRSVLQMSAVALGVLGTATGCRLRLQDDVPAIPLVHERTRMADESALMAALLSTWRLEDLAQHVPGSRRGAAARLVSAYARQGAVLAALLRQGGAPLPAKPSPAPSPVTPPVPAARALLTAEQASLSAGLAALPRLTAAHLPLMVSLLAQRGTAVVQQGSRVGWHPPGLATASAASLLASAQAASYGLEVVAAQTDSAHRPLALGTLAVIRSRTSTLQLLAGTGAAPPPLGYRLPWAIRDTASADRLATLLLATSSQGLAAAAPSASGNAAALGALVRWIADDEVLAAKWGSTPGAFPGLVSP